MAKFFITTPIYYVNDAPHVGSAYPTLASDVLARAHRQAGDDVLFLTGTDEHGAKLAQKAAESHQEPRQFVDAVSQEFTKAWQALAISNDKFVRTTDPQHIYLVGQVMQRLYDTDYIYEGQYEGWYCVGCEEYKDVTPENGQLPDCEIHQKPLELVKEDIYYFRLSRFQGQLVEIIRSNQMKVHPEARKNEILAFLEGQPLRDIPVTRSKVNWGIPVPFAPSQTVYVWFDALLNYLSFSDGKSILEPNTGNQTWWPADLQLLGKDILRFHAVIWPALLLALKLPLPKELFAHGFFTINGQKMSKSLGNVIRPAELIERYGVDATRFLILSAVPYGSDGDISIDRLDGLYTAHLANGIGNLLQRVISLINRYGIKPQIDARPTNILEAYMANDISAALTRTNILVDEANRYIASTAPWAMENTSERETVLVNCYQTLLSIAEAIVPIMPTTAEKMKHQLETLAPEPLFPRLPAKE